MCDEKGSKKISNVSRRSSSATQSIMSSACNHKIDHNTKENDTFHLVLWCLIETTIGMVPWYMDWILLALVWHLDEEPPLLANYHQKYFTNLRWLIIKLHHVGPNLRKGQQFIKTPTWLLNKCYAEEASHCLPDGSFGVGYVVCQGVLREWCQGHGALLSGFEVFGCFCFGGDLWQTREVINRVENGENTPWLSNIMCFGSINVKKAFGDHCYWVGSTPISHHVILCMQLVQQWIVIHHMQK